MLRARQLAMLDQGTVAPSSLSTALWICRAPIGAAASRRRRVMISRTSPCFRMLRRMPDGRGGGLSARKRARTEARRSQEPVTDGFESCPGRSISFAETNWRRSNHGWLLGSGNASRERRRRALPGVPRPALTRRRNRPAHCRCLSSYSAPPVEQTAPAWARSRRRSAPTTRCPHATQAGGAFTIAAEPG